MDDEPEPEDNERLGPVTAVVSLIVVLVVWAIVILVLAGKFHANS